MISSAAALRGSAAFSEIGDRLMRLQKYMAMCGVASRRHSEELITQGRVTVDGRTIREMGSQVEAGQDVRVDGVPIRLPDAWMTYVFYKPQAVVTTMQDPQGRPTVADYFRDLPGRFYPVGRLDYDTEGLLLVTNDGDLAQVVAHPRYVMEKTYLTVIRGILRPEDRRALERGIMLEDGMTAPAALKILERRRETTLLEITIHEGRNRQVRRMFDAVGYSVQYLLRNRLGPISLNGLQPGERRLITDTERNELLKARTSRC